MAAEVHVHNFEYPPEVMDAKQAARSKRSPAPRCEGRGSAIEETGCVRGQMASARDSLEQQVGSATCDSGGVVDKDVADDVHFGHR